MSDSVRPHRWQPTRLPCPIPGILQARTLEWGAIAFSIALSSASVYLCIATKFICTIFLDSTYEVKWRSCSVMFDSLRPHYNPWNSPGQNTRVGSRPLLQGIFPTQGSNPGLLHCRWILYQLSHKGSPISWWTAITSETSLLLNFNIHSA